MDSCFLENQDGWLGSHGDFQSHGNLEVGIEYVAATVERNQGTLSEDLKFEGLEPQGNIATLYFQTLGSRRLQNGIVNEAPIFNGILDLQSTRSSCYINSFEFCGMFPSQPSIQGKTKMSDSAESRDRNLIQSGMRTISMTKSKGDMNTILFIYFYSLFHQPNVM